jgi:hypothetical protein
MNNPINWFVFAFLLLPVLAPAQTRCLCSLDTAKILANENLDGFTYRMRTDAFEVLNDKKAIPVFVKKQLDCLAEGFKIANPDEEYACCCTDFKDLPRRKLIFLAKSKDMLALTYLRGGFGVSTHLLLIRFDKNKIVDIWAGFGHESIQSVPDLLQFIDLNRDAEWGLNTNIIYF